MSDSRDSERRRIDDEQETLQGIQEVLQREHPNRTIAELWADTLSIYRVQCERAVLLTPDGEHVPDSPPLQG
ncbi:MAG: hypothetical protein NVSMB22_01690 [Chloroflexota bacterium]